MKDAHKKWILDGFSLALRWSLAITFIYACIHKISVPYDFALQVATYQLLPLSIINLQAVILPWVELVTGVLLIVGLFTRPAALITCGMNIMFIVAIALALSADLQLQCGCFAAADVGDQMDSSLIVRDAIFLVIGAAVVAIRPDRLTVDRWLEKRRQTA
jgi:uncharacterized membrane protein YphA (DoxX/SURF4 family)